MKSRASLWKLSVLTTPEAEDAVSELLQTFFNLSPSTYTDVETGETIVSIYLSSPKHQARPAAETVRQLRNGLGQIKSCGLDLGAGKISYHKIRHEDWANSWKRHFKPMEIGAVLLIRPSWSKCRPRVGQVEVVLDPGLSFGTGHHPTTSFCLEQLVQRSSQFRQRSNNQKPTAKNHKLSFLDIGTGSGILAIVAAKLGYSPVEAFDFDPEAVRIARENARQNQVKFSLARADITKLPQRTDKKFEFICANLISTLLIQERKRIVSRLKPGGVLVLAGILKSEFSSVQHAYEKSGLKLIAARTGNEWRSGAFKFLRQPRRLALSINLTNKIFE